MAGARKKRTAKVRPAVRTKSKPVATVVSRGNRPKPQRDRPHPPKKLSRRRKLNTSLRYSNDWKAGKIQPTIHAATHSLCCWCHVNYSTEIHHAAYEDAEGVKVKTNELKYKGLLLFPVCDGCHIPVLHCNRHWHVPKVDPLWKSKNTPEALRRLQLGYQMLSQGVYF